MPEAPSSVPATSQLPALTPIAAHELHILLQVTQAEAGWKKLDVTFADLVGPEGDEPETAAWIPDDIHAALRQRYGTQSVWESAKLTGGDDLHPHLRMLVNGENPKLMTMWTATTATRRLLSKADNYAEDTPAAQRCNRSLALLPSKAARRRLGGGGIKESDVICYRLTIETLRVYGFRTELQFAHACIRVVPFVPGQGKPLDRALLPVELLEANVALVRVGTLAWLEMGQELPAKPKTFTLGRIIRNLACGGEAADKSGDRIFAYTYAQFAEHVPPADADWYGLYLARHYTSDYAVAPSQGGVTYVRDFLTVGHVMALEGAATLVAPEHPGASLPDFLKNYGTGTLQKNYVPIALLAQHEHAFLVNKTTESNFWPEIRNKRGKEIILTKDIKHLEALRDASLEFRLAFRFSQVSLITMHNQVNLGFRSALGLDRMLAELSADVAEAAAHLSIVQREAIAERVEAERNRFVHYTKLAAAIVFGLAVYNDAEAFLINNYIKGIWSLAITLAAVYVAYKISLTLALRELRQTGDATEAAAPSHHKKHKALKPAIQE